MSLPVFRASLPTVLTCTVACLGVTGAAEFLPSDFGLLLAAWVLASVPLGIGIGHCVLTGE